MKLLSIPMGADYIILPINVDIKLSWIKMFSCSKNTFVLDIQSLFGHFTCNEIWPFGNKRPGN